MMRSFVPGLSWKQSVRALVVTGVVAVWCGLARPASAAPAGTALGAEAYFGDFTDARSAPTPDELRAQLLPVPGARSEIVETKTRGRTICRAEGLFRLAGEWSEQAGVRLGLSETSQLQIHFWNGLCGVTLRFYPAFHRSWAAYGTCRQGDEPQPARYALWATDEGRYQRSGTGTFEVHYRRGNLLLVRGNAKLLSVPFAGPPGEVYLECKGLIRGIERCPGRGVPDAPRTRHAVLGTAQPAELLWQTAPLPGIVLERLGQGQVELRAGENAEPALAWTSLPRPGLYEYIFEVESPSAGTGVYLGDGRGKPLIRVGFFDHRESGQRTFDLQPVWAGDTVKSYALDRQVVPFAGRRQWLRLVLGAGVAKLWTSGDAVHWSQIAPKAEQAAGPCWSVGLYCLPGQKQRSIRLCSVWVRPLDALASLVPESVQQYVGALVDADNLEAWDKQVAETRPPHVPSELWWRACALRTLGWSSKATLGQVLLDRLQEQVAAEPRDPQRLLAFLEESTLLRSNEPWDAVERLAAHAERLGLSLICRGESAPATAISDALMRLSFWTQRRLPLFSEKLVRHELVARMGEDRWDDVRAFCQRMRYWKRTDPPEDQHAPWTPDIEHLVTWGQVESGKPGTALPEEASRREAGAWLARRHPLVERLSKEGYNVLAEFQAALAGQAYREACQLIAASAHSDVLGLLPDRKDPRLLVSLPVAVEAAMHEHPALRQTMREQFAPLSRLRLRRAIGAGDPGAVEAVAMQFYGTEAAGEAHAWLGDRALAAGRFAQAIARYQAAMRSAPAEEHDALGARMRLAAAMLGADEGPPVRAAVQFGASRLSAGEFEQLLGQLRAARQSAVTAAGLPAVPAPGAHPGPTPGRYQTRPWAAMDGQQVQRPGSLPDRGIDWAGRQTTVLVTPERMFVNNRVQQAAFELATGKLLWAQRRTPEPKDQQWPLMPMQPVLAGNRLFVRRLGDDGPEIICLDAGDGRLLWTAKPGGHAASDPLWLGGDLVILAASYAGVGSELTLSLVGLTAESGQVRWDRPLVELRDYWRRQVPCRATVAGDRVVATAGGCVFSCDASGRLHWLRRQVWIPPAGDSYWNARPWFEQAHEAPLVCSGRVYATQPGVWHVECLDVDSGRLVWRQAVGGLTRVVGLAEGRLLLEAQDQVMALATDSGKPLWWRDVPHRLETQLVGRPDWLLCVQAEPAKEGGKPPQLALVWLELDTGREKLRTLLNTPARPDPLVKPLASQSGRQWGFAASAQEAAKREILEWVRVGEAEVARAASR